METPTFLGLPLPILGFFCFVLAGVFVYVWPRGQKDANRGFWLNLGLHYLHPLAWVLLAMAAFWQNKSTQVAIATAILGGVAFLIFIILWMRDSFK